MKKKNILSTANISLKQSKFVLNILFIKPYKNTDIYMFPFKVSKETLIF